jgi:hypothetical protein
MKLAIAIVILSAIALFAAGYLLPTIRQGTSSRTVDASPELVRSTILDIDGQSAWRANVSAIENAGDGTWTEVTRDGERIEFRILSKSATAISLGFASTRGYTGRWDADIATSPSGGTELTVREQSTVRSPIGRILSRLFFDPEAFARTYLDELDAEIALRKNRND